MGEGAQPDLRTPKGQLDYLSQREPTENDRVLCDDVDLYFFSVWANVGFRLPDGPGKTRALHALKDAKMQFINCIVNLGA